MIGLEEALAEALPSHRIGNEIGRGSFGVVYAAEHVQLGRSDAVKVLGPWYFSDPSIRERFHSEGRMLSGLSHPHIVSLHDFVETDDVCALVMERLDGGCVQVPDSGDEADVAQSCALGVVLCSALHAAHQVDVLHRDIKPENLLFNRDGVLKVTDFGIAKMITGNANASSTMPGGLIGSPAYMAPEQVGGNQIGPPTDVYGAGTVVYQLLSGQLPFGADGEPLEVALRRTRGEPKPLVDVAPTVPAEIASVVMRALSADYYTRYPDAESFGVALASAATKAFGPGWLESTAVPLRAPGPVLDASRVPVEPQVDGANGAAGNRHGALDTVITSNPKATVITASPKETVITPGGGRPFGPDLLLHERVGQGAMGQVFRATQRSTGGTVAVKVLRPELTDDPDVRARFVQEKEILTGIRDPHVVEVRDLVQDGDGLGIVAEFVDGPDLHRYLLERGTLAPAEAVDLTIGLLHGLEHVHARAVVHRDIKPENVLVETGGPKPLAKLTDFGISRLVTGRSITRLTGLVGTPDYMAPELGMRAHASPAADVYSTGVLLYELLCGVTPFAGANPVAVLAAHNDLIPGRPAGVPDQLWSVIMSMVAKAPDQRPSAESCAERLAAILPGLAGVVALDKLDEPPKPTPVPKPWWTRQRVGVLVGACLATAAVVAALVIALSPSPKPPVASQQFGSITVADTNGLPVYTVNHVWSLSGHTLTSDTTIRNVTPNTENITYYEQVPKAVARSASALRDIDPPDPTIVNADPELGFTLTKVASQGVVHITYQATVTAKGPSAQVLANLVNAWMALPPPPPVTGLKVVTLQSIAASPSQVTLKMGQMVVLGLRGEMSDDTGALPSELQAATWTSSDPGRASVDSHGVVTGKGAGLLTVTAGLNGLSVVFHLTVLAITPVRTTAPHGSGGQTARTSNNTGPGPTPTAEPTPTSPTSTSPGPTTKPTTATTIRHSGTTATTARTVPPTSVTTRTTTTTTIAFACTIDVYMGLSYSSSCGQGNGSSSSTGNGNQQWGAAQECNTTVSNFSVGHYPPNDCAAQGYGYKSPTNSFRFSGNANCSNAGRTDSGSAFTWNVGIPKSGHWGVYVYIPDWTSFNLGAEYTLHSTSGADQINLNQQAYQGKWVGLASLSFSANTVYSVTLGTGDSYDGYCHYQPANQVQWVYQGP